MCSPHASHPQYFPHPFNSQVYYCAIRMTGQSSVYNAENNLKNTAGHAMFCNSQDEHITVYFHNCSMSMHVFLSLYNDRNT